ncbi:protein kinase domain-containing protein [Brevibacillus dissolubilis]|uniref:protein kinase domain-containing protein n=1 Tax=Brevibacillus dissolubilis TaxID=1844116 RepID=UPI001117210E|nr:protein kinase [Brevibacillus dissolubilis]
MSMNARCLGCMSEKTADPCPTCSWVEGTEAEAPHFLAPGTLLHGKYLIGRVLGHGGFGITYLGWDNDLNMKLAVKEYLPQGFATRAKEETSVSVYSGDLYTQFTEGLNKFLEEARVLAQFNNHPGVVSVRDFFKENGTAYLVMYYLEGITLKQFLERNGGKIPYETAIEIIRPVLDALHEVHQKGILHRDISPDNIYITKERQVKLLDFGAARQTINEYSKSLSVILKPGYAPVEQYHSKGRQGAWTDVYAVAATIYRAIVGQTPPDSLDRLEEDTLVPPSQLGTAIPPHAERALLQALAIKVNDRLQSMQALQQALAEAEGNQPENTISLPSNPHPAPNHTTPLPSTPHLHPSSTDPLYTSTTLTPNPPPIRNKVWLWIGGAIAGVLALVSSAVGYFIVSSIPESTQPTHLIPESTPTITADSRQTLVPDLLTLSEEEAKDKLTQAYLKPGKINYEESLFFGKGLVMKQSIDPGTSVSENQSVDFIVSDGVQVPESEAEIQQRKFELIEQYKLQASQLDENGNIEDALYKYVQAFQITTILAQADNTPELQLEQAKLLSIIASIELEMKYYKNALNDSLLSVKRLEKLAEQDAQYQSELVTAYSTTAYMHLFNQQPEEAITSAQKALELDPAYLWAKTNLAPAHLFADQADQAQSLYRQANNLMLPSGETFHDIALSDFAFFKKNGLDHPGMDALIETLDAEYVGKEVIQLIYDNAQAINDNKLDAYIATLQPDTVTPEFHAQLKAYIEGNPNLVVETTGIEGHEKSEQSMTVYVTQKEVDTSQGIDKEVKLMFTLNKQADGTWKIYSVAQAE